MTFTTSNTSREQQMNYRNALIPNSSSNNSQQPQPIGSSRLSSSATASSSFADSDAFFTQSSSAAAALWSSSVVSQSNSTTTASSSGGNSVPQAKKHRNTMPSLAVSPFAFSSGSSGSSAASVKSELPGSLNCHLVQFTSGRTDTFYLQQSSMQISVGDYVVVEADRGEDLGKVIMSDINVSLPRRNSISTANSANGYPASFVESQFLPNEYGIYSSSSASSSSNPSPTFELEECISSSNFSSNSSQASLNQQLPAQSNMPKKIYRLAAAVEVESLLAKVRDEMNAIAVAQYKVQEWKLPMVVIDAEYQWDRRKLTFFFSVTLPQYYPNQPSPRIDFRTLVRDLYQIYRTRIWMYCVDKDKNRANRSHNREKFLKGLYRDTLSRSSAPSISVENSFKSGGNEFESLATIKAEILGKNGGVGSGTSSTNGLKNMNSLKAVLEENSYDDDGNDTEWDMSEVFKLGAASPLYNKKLLSPAGNKQILQGRGTSNHVGGIDALEFAMGKMSFGQVGSTIATNVSVGTPAQVVGGGAGSVKHE